MKNNLDVFLDSGAFTAHTSGKEIDLCEYVKFAKENRGSLECVSALDDVTSWEESLGNLAQSDLDIETIPCFHYGEPFDLLKIYVKSYPYISLGGLVVAGYTKFESFLDVCFRDYICDADGYPKVKVHGFAITKQRLMFKYPWYSVDSSTWLRVSNMGSIFLPKTVRGKVRWDKQPMRIQVSAKGPMKNGIDTHIDIMSGAQREEVMKAIAKRGFILGSSKKDGTIIEKGLCNCYFTRDRFNFLYMLDLEDNLPKWPSKFKMQKKLGFI